jgi:hypothetical protein
MRPIVQTPVPPKKNKTKKSRLEVSRPVKRVLRELR